MDRPKIYVSNYLIGNLMKIIYNVDARYISIRLSFITLIRSVGSILSTLLSVADVFTGSTPALVSTLVERHTDGRCLLILGRSLKFYIAIVIHLSFRVPLNIF